MEWKKAWFGSDNPSRQQVIATVVSLGVVGLALLGMFVDFAPSPLLRSIDMKLLFFGVGVAETVLFFAWIVHKDRVSALVQQGWFKVIFLALGAPFLFGMFSWAVFARGLPWIYTRVFGSEFRESYVMETHHRYSRRSCHYYLRGEPMQEGPGGRLCINEGFYRRHPDQRVPVVLVGRRTILGASIEDVYPQEIP